MKSNVSKRFAMVWCSITVSSSNLLLDKRFIKIGKTNNDIQKLLPAKLLSLKDLKPNSKFYYCPIYRFTKKEFVALKKYIEENLAK
ncbi:hypothetical protein H8356DRAFT_1431881 [Neocallimastix lanati (nom. inval.)]|nr:hypothetical protein H8356DRAFT_1431881 [Neocallimastix sp. JGI-2020a]